MVRTAVKRRIESLRLGCGDHAAEPAGYLDWHAWANKKGKTHLQVRCPQCGLYKIWIPKGLLDTGSGGSDGV